MKITILTIFPEMFRDFVREPVMARAPDQKIVELEIVDIRRYAGGSFRHIDDDSYGGGAGMVMRCGHYEGLDERILNHADGLYSIGDYVLTGGELPAKVVCDSVIRLLPGVLRAQARKEESCEQGILEYPQYTKPADWKGEKVPEVLLSGNHERIREWRRQEAVRITRERRPDLLQNTQELP